LNKEERKVSGKSSRQHRAVLNFGFGISASLQTGLDELADAPSGIARWTKMSWTA
jgi:hypothetical protein